MYFSIFQRTFQKHPARNIRRGGVADSVLTTRGRYRDHKDETMQSSEFLQACLILTWIRIGCVVTKLLTSYQSKAGLDWCRCIIYNQSKRFSASTTYDPFTTVRRVQKSKASGNPISNVVVVSLHCRASTNHIASLFRGIRSTALQIEHQ